MNRSDAPAMPDVEWVVAPDEDEQVALDPPCRVLLHNDDITPMDFVVHILRSVFDLSLADAQVVMLKAHYTGMARVGVYPLEDAKYRVSLAHRQARAEGYPLTLTIELED